MRAALRSPTAWWAMLALGLLPLAWLLFAAFANLLGANPAEALIRASGEDAAGFLHNLVTNDINLRLKADVYGLAAEDYETDQVNLKDLYTGMFDLTMPAAATAPAPRQAISTPLRQARKFMPALSRRR